MTMWGTDSGLDRLTSEPNLRRLKDSDGWRIGMKELNELRELNISIAERVMNWQRWAGEDDWNGPNVTSFFPDEQWLTVYELGAEEPTQYFQPSTDIADAMQIVEKMRESGWDVEIGSQREGGWGCTFSTVRRGDFLNCNHTLPLAICRAALEAVEHTDVPALSSTQ